MLEGMGGTRMGMAGEPMTAGEGGDEEMDGGWFVAVKSWGWRLEVKGQCHRVFGSSAVRPIKLFSNYVTSQKNISNYCIQAISRSLNQNKKSIYLFLKIRRLFGLQIFFRVFFIYLTPKFNLMKRILEYLTSTSSK